MLLSDFLSRCCELIRLFGYSPSDALLHSPLVPFKQTYRRGKKKNRDENFSLPSRSFLPRVRSCSLRVSFSLSCSASKLCRSASPSAVYRFYVDVSRYLFLYRVYGCSANRLAASEEESGRTGTAAAKISTSLSLSFRLSIYLPIFGLSLYLSVCLS